MFESVCCVVMACGVDLMRVVCLCVVCVMRFLVCALCFVPFCVV